MSPLTRKQCSEQGPAGGVGLTFLILKKGADSDEQTRHNSACGFQFGKGFLGTGRGAGAACELAHGPESMARPPPARGLCRPAPVPLRRSCRCGRLAICCSGRRRALLWARRPDVWPRFLARRLVSPPQTLVSRRRDCVLWSGWPHGCESSESCLTQPDLVGQHCQWPRATSAQAEEAT